jgi:DHA1 family tetracycline resistance protein-like MFS transporter
MSTARTPAIFFIFFTLLLDVIGFGLVIPVLPGLLEEMTGGDLSTASKWGGLLMFTYAGMQFLFSPVMGALSDAYGRRPVILASLFAFSLDFVLQGWAPTLGWFFLGRVIAGITGATFTSATAYIADVSPPEKRAQNFGIIGAAFGMGFIIGPLLGGLVAHYGGLRAPFFAAAALAMINALYGFFILPESLTPENRRPFDWKRANPVGSLRQLGKYPVILGLIGALLLIQIAGHANMSTWTYITMEKFRWGSFEVGMSLAFVGLVSGIVQGLLSRKIIPALGANKAVTWGLFMYGVGFVLFAYATQGWMMYAFMIPFGLGGIAGPALQSIISNQVPANAQGELQGGLTSLMSLTSIIGPLVMTNLFAYFTQEHAPIHFPGAPFLLGAVLTFMSLIWAKVSLGKPQN